MQICVIIDFTMIHIFREDNSCVDRLPNLSMENKIKFILYFIIDFNSICLACKKFVIFWMGLV